MNSGARHPRCHGSRLTTALAALFTAACASVGSPASGPEDAGQDDGQSPPSSPGSDASTGGDSSSGSGPSTSDGGSSSGSDSSPSADSSSGSAGDASSAPPIDRLLALTKSCTGSAIVSSHTYSANNGNPVDVCKLNGAVYYTAKMAIDCDGRTTPNCPGTGANKDCCYYNDTSFHNPQGQPLAAEYDPYVVIPLDFSYPGLDQTNGGNIIIVIYNNQLEYAVFGDQGPTDLIGEASFRTAANLGINSSPASGGVGGDVTYIVFVGAGTQPADMENQSEIKQLGAQLVQELLVNNP